MSALRKSKGSNPNTRRRLSEAQNHRCAYCTIEMTLEVNQLNSVTLDHIIPRSQFRKIKDKKERLKYNKDENIVAACPRCNSTRGNADAISFYNGIYQTRAYVQRLGEHPIKGNGTQRRAETRKRKAKNKELRKLREEAGKLAALEDGSKDNLLRTFREMGWKL